MFKNKYKNDLLLVVSILAFALILFAVFKFNLKDGKRVNVLLNGKTVATYNLTDTVKTNVSPDSKNILVIENGKAYISEADCPDKICVAHRKISKTGETIVCLPHKLVIEISKE